MFVCVIEYVWVHVYYVCVLLCVCVCVCTCACVSLVFVKSAQLASQVRIASLFLRAEDRCYCGSSWSDVWKQTSHADQSDSIQIRLDSPLSK